MLQTFKCREIAGTWYLEADYHLQCYTSDWSIHAIVATLGLLMYSLGIPVLDYLLLQRNRHKLFTGSKFRARYGFIFFRYEPQYFWYESVEMLRKFSLGGVVMFVQSGSMMQCVAAIMMSTVFLVIHGKFQPFDDDLDDDLQSVSLIGTFLTLIAATLIKGKEGSELVTVFVLAINLLVIGFAVWTTVVDTIPSLIEEYQIKYDQAMESLKLLKSKFSTDVVKTFEPEGGMDVQESNKDKDQNAPELPHSPAIQFESSEVDSHISKLFARYDLDSSGTLNTKDELEQLSYNLAFKLRLENSTKDMDTYLSQVPELTDDNAWDEQTFSLWFKEKILQGE